LTGHRHDVTSVQYTSCGKYIGSGSVDKTIKIWDAHTYKLIGTCIGHKDGVSSVCFDDDNRYILSGSYDFTCILWDFESF
jgi:WD40 repeat protein